MKLRRRQQDTRLDMTPLIDVVFLLLVFFVFALVLMVRADTLDLQLPRVGTGTPAQAAASIRVTLVEDGGILLEGEPVELSGIGAAVQGRIEESEGSSVLLSADARAPAGALIELADALVAAGITEFSVLGSPSTDSPDGENPTPVEDE